MMCIMILFLLLPATLTFDPPCYYLIRPYHFTSRIWGEGRIFFNNICCAAGKDSLYVDVIMMCIMILFLLLPATLTFDPPCCYLIRPYHFTSRIWGEGRIFLLRVHLPQQHCISSQSTCVGHILR
jgi:hypothetical protein